MSNKHISLAPVPDPGSIRAAMARAEAKRVLERTDALRMWQLGYDTKDIASHLNCKESWIYNQLPKWRLLAKSEASA